MRDRIWGAPDLVIEVLSPGTRRRDSRDKRRWYRQYGVREYWIIDPILQMIEVIPFCAPRARGRVFRGLQPVASHVLPAFAVPAKEFFK